MAITARLLSIAVLATVLVASAAACSSDENVPNQAARSQTQSAAGVATPATTSELTPIRSTGIASIDRAVGAAISHDIDGLIQQVQYTKQPCVTKTDGPEALDKRPACPIGNVTGDLVDGFLLTNGCVGSFAGRGEDDRIRGIITDYFRGPVKYFGAYETPAVWGAGEYTVIFTDAPGFPGQAVMLILEDMGVVGVARSCGSSPQTVASHWTPVR